ncbi:unnamed protein product [Orchesella dallaii]|uniref:Insulin-like peptide 7 n=1 Tax=Orchesella dallaii TaxID=48710 RepID=A0ABP1R5N6_9HEXA
MLMGRITCYSFFPPTAAIYKVVAFLALLSLLPSPPSTATANLVKEAELQKMFKLRNENQWKSLWHQEKHVRCRDQLLTHMDWACQKDIYRLEKRFRHHPNQDTEDDPTGIFISKPLADTLIKPWSGYARRKREDKSITDECCSVAGCTWEEYAEYCPAHRRQQSRRRRR